MDPVTEGAVEIQDPHRQTRMRIAIPAGVLLGASGFFGETVRLHPDGSHGPLVGMDLWPTLIFLIVAGLAIWFAARPTKPDPRIAQAVMLAAAIVAIVVAVAAFVEARGIADQAPGVAPYLQSLAAVGFLVLRWKRSLWPASRWLIEAQKAAAERTPSRRQGR